MQTERANPIPTASGKHRLSLRSWENAEGVTGWSLKDQLSGIIVARSHFSEPEGTLNIWRRFLGNDRVEAMLCAEIDREYPEEEDNGADR